MDSRKIGLLGCFFITPCFAQAQYDLVLRGGHVVDAKNKISAVRDVGIRDGKIAAVADHIDPAQAFKLVDG